MQKYNVNTLDSFGGAGGDTRRSGLSHHCKSKIMIMANTIYASYKRLKYVMIHAVLWI